MHRSAADKRTAFRNQIGGCFTRIMFGVAEAAYMMLGCVLIAKLWHCIVKLNGLFGFVGRPTKYFFGCLTMNFQLLLS